jgi:hypothetical protein
MGQNLLFRIEAPKMTGHVGPVSVDLGLARWMHGARLGGNAYLILQSKYLRARTSELESIKTSAGQARAARNISDKLLIVLTGGKNSDEILSHSLTKQDFDEFRRIWVEQLQRRLACLSTRGKQIILRDCGHDIPSERPDAIV